MTKNRILSLKFDEHKNSLANMAYEDISWLWHLRYMNLNFCILNLITPKALIFGLPKVEEHMEVCEGCAKGKRKRDKFLKDDTWRVYYPLHLVHSYI